MSRFANLEFDDESRRQALSSQGAPVQDDSQVFSKAQHEFENGDFEAALRLYSKVLEFNPLHAPAWTGQVRMLIELGEFQEANLWADKALERFPNEPELLAAKAVALGRLGDTQAALAFSDSAIQERGDTPYVWLARGDVLLARKENRAQFCLDKALSLAPGDWLVAWLAARIRLYYEQFALALKLMQQAVELNASHFMLWIELGRCQQSLGLAGAAKNSLAQARQLNPGCSLKMGRASELGSAGLWQRMLAWWSGIGRS